MSEVYVADVSCVPMAVRLTGPFGLGVAFGTGICMELVLERGHTRNPDGRKASIHCLGDLAEDSQDASLVALSFVRAHAGWFKRRYGFYIDPRQHKPADYLFMIKRLEFGVTGGSAGAAIAGTLLLSTSGHFSFLC